MARVLVVEDDCSLRFDLEETLRSWGHDVRSSGNGQEGFAHLIDWGPQLVLSDINMPGSTGYDLLQQIRDCGYDEPDMAFFFITSVAAPGSIIRGINNGADEYFTKPLDYCLLRAKIESFQRRVGAMKERSDIDALPNASFAGVLHAAILVGSLGILGVGTLMVVYWFKTVLGINVFADVHLSDFW